MFGRKSNEGKKMMRGTKNTLRLEAEQTYLLLTLFGWRGNGRNGSEQKHLNLQVKIFSCEIQLKS